MRFSRLIALALLTAACGLAETKNGFFEEYVLESPMSGPAIVAIDDFDTVWVALAKSGKLGRFDNGRVTTYELGTESRPVGLAVGNKSNGYQGIIWIAASYDNKLIRFEAATGKTREYKIDGDQSWPFNVAIGPDHKVWFTERAANRLGSFDPLTETFQHYDVPTAQAGPAGLAMDWKSGLVWFTESYADGVASFNPATGKFNEIRMSPVSTGLTTGPAGLCIDRSGVLWFAKLEGKLGRLDPREGKIQILDVPAEAMRPAGITSGADGQLWAVALDGDLLLNYNPATSKFATYPLPTGTPDNQASVPPFAKTARPFGIALDSQDNVWFSEQYAGKLGVLDVAAPRAQFRSPAPVVKTGLTPVALDVYDRVSGVQDIRYLLDGHFASITRGQLDLTSLAPGPHVLEALVTDRAGFTTTASVNFNFTPGPVAVFDSLYQLRPTKPESTALKTQLLTEAVELLKGDPRPRIRSFSDRLVPAASGFEGFNEQSWTRLTGFVTTQGGKQMEVHIVDSSPFFAPATLTVDRGTNVRWVYDPPSSGHAISHNLHRVNIKEGTQSPVLRAGESFAYVFAEPGTYEIRDEYQKDAVLRVEVKSAEAKVVAQGGPASAPVH